jgi:hypothetical protein
MGEYDRSSAEFVVRTEKGEVRIAAAKVVSIYLGAPAEIEPRAVAAIYQDGTRLTGDLVKVDEEALWLSSDVIGERFRLPLAGLRSLAVLGH